MHAIAPTKASMQSQDVSSNALPFPHGNDILIVVYAIVAYAACQPEHAAEVITDQLLWPGRIASSSHQLTPGCTRT